MMPRKRIVNHYFKDQDPARPLMSGLPLPKDADGVVRNIDFEDCDFHHNCRLVKFEGCRFYGCEDPTRQI